MRSLLVNALVSLTISLGVGAYAGSGRSPAPSPYQATHFLFLAAGTCPAGWTQDTTFDGKYLRVTVAAHGDVGQTGGSSTLTATGANSAPLFTGAADTTTSVSGGTPAGTVSSPTFTGDSVASSAVSAGTPAGTNGTVSFTPAGTNGTGTVTATGTVAWPAGVPTFAGQAFTDVINHTHNLVSTSFTPRLQGGTTGSTTGTHLMASAATGGSLRNAAETTVAATPATGNPSGGVSSITPAGTVAWPAGVPTFSGSSATTSAQTFTGGAGTVPAETFTGAALGTHTHTTTATGTVSQPTFSGDALSGHTHTVTPTGTVAAPTFTGDAVMNTPSYVNLILCKPAGTDDAAPSPTSGHVQPSTPGAPPLADDVPRYIW